MSKRNRGQRARTRRNKLVAARAELAILLENRLEKYHMQLNTYSTEKLLEHVRAFNVVPLWAQRNYVKQSTWFEMESHQMDAFKNCAGFDKWIKPSA